MFITYRFRVKDGAQRTHLRRLSTACNQVWNYFCAIQRETEKRWKLGSADANWKSHFDLLYLTIGSSAELGIHSDTIDRIAKVFTKARDQARHAPRFRSSFGSKRSLGWVPMVARAFQLVDGALTYRGRTFRFWQSRAIEGKIKTAEIVETASGKWFVCFLAEVEDKPSAGIGVIGIDLGLKSLATTSDGDAIDIQHVYRKHEAALGKAQRARNKRRVSAIHEKIANVRKHFLHEQSTRLVRENRYIAVGDVNPSSLAKTRMAKSVLDAGWSMFRNMLAYKSSRARVSFVIVSERMTSQTCSCCGTVPDSSPKGMGALGVRYWVCSHCGASHDRDVNAARNILRVGLKHQPLVGEMPHAA